MPEIITAAFERWWESQSRAPDMHDAFLEAWLRGALIALEIDQVKNRRTLERLAGNSVTWRIHAQEATHE